METASGQVTFSRPSSYPTIHLLSDGISYWDGGGAFGLVPRVRWMKLLPPDEFNRVPQDLRSVLIQVDHGSAQTPRRTNILVDCGVGVKPNEIIASQYEVRRPNGTLLDDVGRHGLQSEDIDIVIFTHLHGDHSGWATIRTDQDTYAPTFPNAHYYVQRREYEDATHTNERTRNTYFAENFVPLMEHGVLTLLDGAADIAPSVHVVPTPGHTAGHQSVLVETGSRGAEETGRRGEEATLGGEAQVSSAPLLPVSSSPVLVLGDLATYMIQFARLAWVTAYDVLPLQTIESKRYWQQWALERQALLISPHDTITPAGMLVKDDKGFLQVQLQGV